MSAHGDRLAQIISARDQAEMILRALDLIAPEVAALRSTVGSVVGTRPSLGPAHHAVREVDRLHLALAEIRGLAQAVKTDLTDLRSLL